jgi:hypothetical protein
MDKHKKREKGLFECLSFLSWKGFNINLNMVSREELSRRDLVKAFSSVMQSDHHVLLPFKYCLRLQFHQAESSSLIVAEGSAGGRDRPR